MKKHLKFLVLLISFTLISCGSASNYSKNSLNQNFFKDKTIHFLFNNKSIDKVSFKGPRIGVVNQPNVKETFKESIKELAQETKLNLKVIGNVNEASDDGLIIDAEITEILWSFGFSTATMKTSVNYKTNKNDRIYSIQGIRKSGGGSEKNNLRKSLKNATYNFLKELQK